MAVSGFNFLPVNGQATSLSCSFGLFELDKIRWIDRLSGNWTLHIFARGLGLASLSRCVPRALRLRVGSQDVVRDDCRQREQ